MPFNLLFLVLMALSVFAVHKEIVLFLILSRLRRQSIMSSIVRFVPYDLRSITNSVKDSNNAVLSFCLSAIERYCECVELCISITCILFIHSVCLKDSIHIATLFCNITKCSLFDVLMVLSPCSASLSIC